MKIALDPYMLPATPLPTSPAWSPTSATSTSSCRRGTTSSRSSCIPRARPGPVRRSGRRWTRPGWRSPPSCRSTAGPGRTRTSGRPRSGTGSGPSRSPSISAVDVMNSEFNGRPGAGGPSEAQFWRSMEELLPVFEREGVQLRLEPHPDDFIEDGTRAVDMIRGINSDLVTFLYCAPHTFHQGGDMPASWSTPASCSPTCTWPTRSTTARPRGCATSSTRRVRRRGSTSTSTSARARSTGTRSSGRSARWASTADHDRLRVRLGGTGPRVRPASTGSGSSRRSSPGPDLLPPPPRPDRRGRFRPRGFVEKESEVAR